jgi:transglycosylase-like protein with SLT domain/sporulation related protein
VTALSALWFTSPTLAVAPPAKQLAGTSTKTMCEIISREARRRALPESFFARLIWKESLFDPKAISPKGAQGIAQFMPDTARARGLADPFQPGEALPASAHFLFDLQKTFGNLGLAAAAYNAGEDRVRSWLDGRGGLPAETVDYVFFITGRPASDWKRLDARYDIPPIEQEGGPFMTDCMMLASRHADPTPAVAASAARKPWGVQLAGSHSEAAALAMFGRIRARHADVLAGLDPLVIRKRNPGMGPRRMVNVRIGAGTRSEAEQLCAKLLSRNCACVVLRN